MIPRMNQDLKAPAHLAVIAAAHERFRGVNPHNLFPGATSELGVLQINVNRDVDRRRQVSRGVGHLDPGRCPKIGVHEFQLRHYRRQEQTVSRSVGLVAVSGKPGEGDLCSR